MSDLIYKEKLWDFYKANVEDMDRILWAAAWKFRNVMEPEDLRQEIIIRMQRSKFLAKYDAKKSSLSTYVMQYALWSAQHAIESELAHANQQVLVQDLNTPAYEGEALPELVDHCDVEEVIDARNLLEQVNARLDETSRKVLNYYLQGCTFKEIGEALNCSIPYVGHTNTKIKETFLRVKNCTRIVRSNKVLAAVKPLKLVLTTEHKISKNNHRVAKVRELTYAEKMRIQNELFLPASGMISNDACVAFKATMAKEITIFQITGQIVGLHRKVAKGELTVSRPEAYQKYLADRRKLWSSYKSPRYQKMGEKNAL